MRKILLILAPFIILYSCESDSNKSSTGTDSTQLSKDLQHDCPEGVEIPRELQIHDSEIGDAMSEHMMTDDVRKTSAAWDINVGYLRHLIKSMGDDKNLRFHLVAIRSQDMLRRTVLQPDMPASDQVNTPTLIVVDPASTSPVGSDIARRVCPPPPEPACKFPKMPGDTIVVSEKPSTPGATK